jgi:hypothetical protein
MRSASRVFPSRAAFLNRTPVLQLQEELAAAAAEIQQQQELAASAAAAASECEVQWRADVESLQQQALAAAAAASAQQLSVELSLKACIKSEQQQKIAAMDVCR